MAAKLRVAQWATGNIGAHAIKAVSEHPQMELVGLWVHSQDKVGRDAGDLAGLGRELGVKATNSLEDILALKSDVVLYMPQYLNLDEVCRLLETGSNIVTTVVEFHDPESLDPQVRARVEDACRRGGTSIHSTGSSPGFISEVLPFALTTLVRRLDGYSVDEYADMTSRDSPMMIFDVLGYGKKPGAFDERQIAHIRNSFGQSFSHTARALGMPLDRFEAKGEFGVARSRTQIAAGELEPGTVGALRISVTGYRGDKPVMRFRANWYCTKDLEEDWDLRDTGWRVQVEGDTPLDISIAFPCSAEDYPKISPGFTAHPAVNAVPALVAAEPGIRTAADLRIVPNLGPNLG
jgi:4-hydroxy-tetrahydrodipicolinate reductase